MYVTPLTTEAQAKRKRKGVSKRKRLQETRIQGKFPRLMSVLCFHLFYANFPSRAAPPVMLR